MVVGIAIMVGISRWIFRINEILACEVEMAKRLDRMITLLEKSSKA